MYVILLDYTLKNNGNGKSYVLYQFQKSPLYPILRDEIMLFGGSMPSGRAGTEARLVEEKVNCLSQGRGDDITGCPWRLAIQITKLTHKYGKRSIDINKGHTIPEVSG